MTVTLDNVRLFDRPAFLPLPIRGQRLPQLQDAAIGTVARLARLHRLDCGLLDAGRGRQVHVADVKGIDNVPRSSVGSRLS